MIYAGFSIFIVIFIYFNVLGLFRGYWKMPASAYKEKLWHFKKIEIAEKAVQSAVLVFMILSMRWAGDQIATVCLAGLAVMMTLEYFFGKYLRKAFVCPKCGGPIWEGNFVVILQPWRICPHCNHHLSPEQNAVTEESDAEHETFTE